MNSLVYETWRSYLPPECPERLARYIWDGKPEEYTEDLGPQQAIDSYEFAMSISAAETGKTREELLAQWQD